MKRQQRFTYTLLDVLRASPTQPMPAAIRDSQLTRMWNGLASLERGHQPTSADWGLCSDAVNFMETLVAMGVCEDGRGLLRDAVEAIALAGERHVEHGHPIRLSGAGMQAVRAVLEDYASALEQITHRTAVNAHRRTERRVREILIGKPQPHDVKVIAI